MYYKKSDFTRALLTDFYYYVCSQNGGKFPCKKYNSLSSYLAYLSSSDGVKNNFRVVANDVSGWFLKRDPFGKLENQKNKKGFIGYCMSNGRYEDFFYYLKDAFYSWRTDEKHLIYDPDAFEQGRDMLSDSWAAFVEMCKIFYYDGDTIQQVFPKTYRTSMLVRDFPFVATPDRTLPVQYDPEIGLTVSVKLTRPGYTFTGWYADPSCTGDKITAIPAGTTGDITLYAGWVKN